MTDNGNDRHTLDDDWIEMIPYEQPETRAEPEESQDTATTSDEDYDRDEAKKLEDEYTRIGDEADAYVRSGYRSDPNSNRLAKLKNYYSKLADVYGKMLTLEGRSFKDYVEELDSAWVEDLQRVRLIPDNWSELNEFVSSTYDDSYGDPTTASGDFRLPDRLLPPWGRMSEEYLGTATPYEGKIGRWRDSFDDE